MKYLVLHQFRSFGKTLHKGQIVDESEIRSPSLRRSEGKITPAVSSSTVPEEEVTEVSVAPPQASEDVDTGKQPEQTEQTEQTEQPVQPEQPEQPKQSEQTEQPKKFSLFAKK